MEILKKFYYAIDYDNEIITTRDIPNDFDEYITALILNFSNNSTVRHYKGRSGTTQVLNCSNELVKVISSDILVEEKNNRIENYCNQIARRLLNIEKRKQEEIHHLGQNVIKGSLIIAILTNNIDEDYSLLIAKVEHVEYYDDDDLNKKTGIPSRKPRIWKSAILKFSMDSNRTIVFEGADVYLDREVKYWANEFLEFDEMHNDEFNTNIAFKNIESILTRNLKRIAPSDYMIIRNSFIGKLKTAGHLNYDEMVDDIFSGYMPIDEDIIDDDKLNEIKEKILELPDKHNFDRQFITAPHMVKARIKKIFKVISGIEIKISDYVDNMKVAIESFIDETNGEKFIKIKTDNDDLFETFRR